jgi:hypothetical protein
MPKPLYPGLYGWQVTYQLPDGSVVFCSCFHEAMRCFFKCLRNELADSYLRTHHKKVEGERLLKLAFSRFTNSINPVALKALFPECNVLSHEPRLIDGKEFFFSNRDIKAPKLDETFWNLPESGFRFEEKICEVCTGRVPKHFYCHQMYGGPFIQVYGAWIKAEIIRQGYVDWRVNADKTFHRKLWREAENRVREIVGVPHIGEKFISETILFKTIAYLLKDYEVIHHHRADWLARQELDIFVPSLNLAIEYQGEQHFESIDAWGGEEALERTQQRDEEKRRKCESNGIRLVYFDHTMKLTEKFVAHQLEQVLAKSLL